MFAFQSPLNLVLSLVVTVVLFACNQSEAPPPDPSSEDDMPLVRAPMEPQIAEYVVEVFEDSKGNLWMGSMNYGTARYDGEELTYFTPDDGLVGLTISSIVEDKNGTLWFGSHTGASSYDGETFKTVAVSSGVHNVGAGWMSVTDDGDGNIWASSNEGVFQIVDGELKPFELPIEAGKIDVYSITPGRATFGLKDSKGNLWFKTDGAGAFRYDGSTFTQFTKADGLCTNSVNNIVEDKDGNIWFGCMQAFQPEMTNDGGVCVWNGEQFTTFPDKKGMHNSDIYTIYRDRSDNIWIGALGTGAYRYDGTDFSLITLSDRMDLTQSWGIQSLCEDRNGYLWAGMSGGLFRLDGGTFMNVTQGGPWKPRQ